VKPPFTYFGGKTAIAEQIVPYLPPHEHYIEPFAGSLAVLLSKPKSLMETVNDIDGDLVNFWQVLRTRTTELVRVCALTPHSRAELAASYEPADDELERARRVWIRLTQARSGQHFKRTGWRYYQDARGSATTMPDYLDSYVARIAPAAARLRAVSLECLPALELIARYGKHRTCLIYADPPYLMSARSCNDRGPSYGHEMGSEQDHRDLADALRSAAASVVLSGYHSPLYDELYDGWHVAEIQAFSGNSRTGNAARTEVVWSNRPFPNQHPMLFDLAEPAS
jgi:DNA adenine methylase